MADWRVSRETISLFPHPNGDNLLLAKLGEYQAVVRKDQYKDGDTVIFVPEKSVLPSFHIQDYFAKYLVGSEKNRVKSNKIRGEISMGIILPDDSTLGEIGQDISDKMSIVKYEPPIPAQLRGMVEGIRTGGSKEGINYGSNLSRHDVQQFFINKDHFHPGEEVLVFEKLHGSQCVLTILEGTTYVSSKGLWKTGLIIKEDNSNSYWQAVHNTQIVNTLTTLYPDKFIQLFSELLPCQKGFSYGHTALTLGVFRLEVNGNIVAYDEVPDEIKNYWVPLLHRGPFNEDLIGYREGMETVSGRSLHIREGVVVSPVKPRYTEGNNPWPLYVKIINPKYKDEESFN